jgi:hypothetical protein
MNKEEILKKAIEKAVKNGWEFKNYTCLHRDTKDLAIALFAKDNNTSVLFDHNFAKAFWGESTGLCHYNDVLYDCKGLPHWMHHIQQLALAEDRLEYISKFL